MRVTFSGKNGQITERDREYAEKKLQKLSRYFNNARDAHLTHSVQRNWQIVEVQLDLDGILLRAEGRAPELSASIDQVADKLEEQVKRFKGKIKRHKGRADAPTVAALMAELPGETDNSEEGLPTVARRKRFALKPMSEDEAALQMELLNHDFFAFLNSESDQVNVIYRRQDGNYGLLELDEG